MIILLESYNTHVSVSICIDEANNVLARERGGQFDAAFTVEDVVLIGAGGRVEIWSKGRWDKTAQFDDVNEIAEHMLNLGFGI